MDFLLAFLKSMPSSVAQGLIWGIMSLGVYITYKVLDYADLTVDGSLCTGGAVAAVLIVEGMNPLLALVFAFIAGMLTGLVTGVLHTCFGIPAILSGILTQLALYSINMRIMGKSNVPLSVDQYPLTVSLRYIWPAVLVGIIAVAIVVAALYWFFGTEIGCAIRATGNNQAMARAQGVNTNAMKVLGLVLSNGLVGMEGALYAQYQGSADINMGRGAIVIGLASVIVGEVVFGNRFNFAYRLASIAGGSIIYYIVIAFVVQCGMPTQDLKLFSALTVAVFLALPYLRGKYFKKSVQKKKGGRTDA